MKLLKDLFKICLGIIIGVFVTSLFVYATGIINSDVIEYDNSLSESSATNVKNAIDDIYGKVNEMETTCGPKEAACNLEDGTLVSSSGATTSGTYAVECTGTYSIQIAAARGGTGGGAYNNNNGTNPGSAGSAAAAEELTITLNKGDMLSFAIGSVGGNGNSYVYGGSGVTKGGTGGTPGGSVGGSSANSCSVAYLAGGGGGGGGYSALYLNGSAIYSIGGGRGGSGAAYNSCSGGAGGYGGSAVAFDYSDTDMTITALSNNSGNGYLKITLVESKYK